MTWSVEQFVFCLTLINRSACVRARSASETD